MAIPAPITDTAEAEAPRRGGRPSRERAARIALDIVEVATEAFFGEGYGATSIETVARRAGISKRTLYSRFPDKAALFIAVVRHVLDHLRPSDLEVLFRPGPLERTLPPLARTIVRAAMDPLALGLHRVTTAEAQRFPEIGQIMAAESGGSEAVIRISAMLEAAAGAPLPARMAQFAAAQLLHMLVGVPQRRGLGLGPPMGRAEQDGWADQTVRLFLDGWRGRPEAQISTRRDTPPADLLPQGGRGIAYE
jgi:AcrR family transcriptional regulator